jgi:hypothetical protein
MQHIGFSISAGGNGDGDLRNQLGRPHLLGARCATQTEVAGGRCFPAASFIHDSTMLKVWYSTVILELFCNVPCLQSADPIFPVPGRSMEEVVVAQGVDEREADHIRLVRGLVDILGHGRKV